MKRILTVMVAFIIFVFLTGCKVVVMPPNSETSEESSKESVSEASNQSEDSSQEEESSESETSAPSLVEELSARYIKLFDDKRFYLKFRSEEEENGEKITVEAEMAMQDDKTAVRVMSDGMLMRFVVTRDQVYMIVDEQKIMMVSAQTQDYNFAEMIPDTVEMQYTSSGTDEFKGRMLPYEEYRKQSADATVACYFFAGNDLVGIRSISSDGTVSDIEILEMNESIPPQMFEIPNDYEIINMDTWDQSGQEQSKPEQSGQSGQEQSKPDEPSRPDQSGQSGQEPSKPDEPSRPDQSG